jgi:hypothetical protein
LGYTIGRGLDAILPFTCYSYWFSCYFDHRGKLMKALNIVGLKIQICLHLHPVLPPGYFLGNHPLKLLAFVLFYL